MASASSWEFYKEVETKILWLKVCAQDLGGADSSINKWLKIRYPEYKIRVVSRKEFEIIKMHVKKKEQ